MKISKHFTTKEFQCNCGCGFGSNVDDIDKKLISILELIRSDIKKPIYLSSGCRCKEYNKKIGGSKNSAHLKGMAADIICINSYDRYSIIKSAIINGIIRIEVRKTWIHIDVDESLPNPILF